MGKIKLYVDEDLTDNLAKVLRSEGFDAISVREVGNQGQPDSQQLSYATSNNRTLLTANISHMFS